MKKILILNSYSIKLILNFNFNVKKINIIVFIEPIYNNKNEIK